MKSCCTRKAVTALFAGLLSLAGCGSGDGAGVDAGITDVWDTGTEVLPDAMTGELPDAGPETRTIPFEPPSYPHPVVDAPFLQEFNHTTNTVEDWIGPLVSVVLPPTDWPDADPVIQVTSRGFARHDWDGEQALDTIDPAHGDLVGAATAGEFLVLAGPEHLYTIGSNAKMTTVAAPDDLVIRGVTQGSGVALVATDQGLMRYHPPEPPPWPVGGTPVNTATESNGMLYVGGDDFVAAYDVLATFPEPGEPQLMWKFDEPGLSTGPVRALVADVILPSSIDIVVIGDKGLQALRNELMTGSGVSAMDVPELAMGLVPLDQPRTAARTSDGGFVVATAGGACRVMNRGHGVEWRVYNSERWLPEEDTWAVATDPLVPDGPLWFATAGGLATVTAKRMTLEEKLVPFVDRIVQRHDRDGAVSDSHLTVKGDLSSNIPWDSDNDGTWTSYWMMGECLRWKLTGDPEAKAHFDKSLDSMLSLRTLTGMDHFVSRAKIRIEGCPLDDCDDPDDGEWFKSVDDEWWMKGDTSNDEVIAHVYLVSFAYDWCADEVQKDGIRDHVRGIVGGLIDNGWQLLDRDGLVTTYGQWEPAYIIDSASGFFGDGGVRAAELLAMLTVADYMTGEPRFNEAKQFLMDEYGYHVEAVNDIDHVFRLLSMDNDEMDSYSWWMLRRYETDPDLLALWWEGWTKLYEVRMHMQQAPWWYLMDWTAGGEPGPGELDYLARWLRLAPVDMIRWNQHNSHRRDLVDPPYPHAEKGGKMRRDGFIIPYDERPCDRWNTDQYQVDGGMGGWTEMDGADVLAPYWLARYFGLIVP